MALECAGDLLRRRRQEMAPGTFRVHARRRYHSRARQTTTPAARTSAWSFGKSLSGIARRIRVLLLPGLSPKGDIIDWTADGGTVEQLWRLVKQAPDWQPPPEQEGAHSRWIWEGDVRVEDARKGLVANLLPETGVALISGQWGAFKTFIALDLASAVMTGAAFIKYPVMRRGGVLLFACEGQNEVAIRIRAAYEARGGKGKGSPRLLDAKADAELAAMIKEAVEKMQRNFGLPVALVIIDTVGKAAGYNKAGDENDAALAKIRPVRIFSTQ
jgi:hypothetical protein